MISGMDYDDYYATNYYSEVGDPMYSTGMSGMTL